MKHYQLLSTLLLVTIASSGYHLFNTYYNVPLQTPEQLLAKAQKTFKKQNFNKTMRLCKKILKTEPENEKAHLLTSKCYLRQYNSKNYAQALPHARAACVKNPGSVANLLNLGTIYLWMGNQSLADETFKRISKFYPDSCEAHLIIGQKYEEHNNIEKAILFYTQALAIDPNQPAAHVSLAGAYLAQGNYEQAYKEYLWRWNTQKKPTESIAMWDGSPVKNKTIVIVGEYGLGDRIQFVRFAQQLKTAGAHIIARVPKALVRLFSLCEYIDQVIPDKEQFPKADYWTSMQNLPAHYKITTQTVSNEPYLRADEKLIKYWKPKISKNHYNVGICWGAGGDGNEPKNRKRTVPLELFAQLAQIPNVRIYNLYKEYNSEDQPPLHIINMGSDFDNSHGGFMDTAALIAQLDLVVTVDTSVAHLAGALGAQTCVLLPYTPDPRWMLNRTDTPWYKNITLFRQQKPGDWQTVMNNVATFVKKKVNITT